MAEPLDLEAIRRELRKFHAGHAPISWERQCCSGCRLVGRYGDALVAEVERLRAQADAATATVARVRALAEAADPSHHAPAEGVLVVVSSDRRERAYLRVDVDGCGPDGMWEPVGRDTPVDCVSYAEALGHDEPPQDRPRVVVEAYVSVDDLVCTLDGVV
jgi:hypothetical protein